MPLRSLLFVPADDDRKMRRAFESGADVVIFDLEDAVAPDRKAEARRILAALLGETRPAHFAIRVNGAEGAPGVTVVEGAMVDKAHLRLARKILRDGRQG